MAAIDFPNSPTTGQSFTVGTKTWVYDGFAWSIAAYDITATNTQTASYVAVLTDSGKIVEMNVATANTFTVPPGVFSVNASLDVVQIGVGQTTITPGSGVTLLSSGSRLKLTGQYSAASMYQRASNVWVVMGDLSL